MTEYQLTWYEKYLNTNINYDNKIINELINKLNNKNVFNYDIRKDTIFVTLSISEKITSDTELILDNNKKINIYK